MRETDLLRLHIEALRVLARTNQPNRAGLIERNIEDYLKTELEKPSLAHLRDAIDHGCALPVARPTGHRVTICKTATFAAKLASATFITGRGG